MLWYLRVTDRSQCGSRSLRLVRAQICMCVVESTYKPCGMDFFWGLHTQTRAKALTGWQPPPVTWCSAVPLYTSLAKSQKATRLGSCLIVWASWTWHRHQGSRWQCKTWHSESCARIEELEGTRDNNQSGTQSPALFGLAFFFPTSHTSKVVVTINRGTMGSPSGSWLRAEQRSCWGSISLPSCKQSGP